MALLLKSIKHPARLEWHEVHPERHLNSSEWVKKVDHYWLEINIFEIARKLPFYGEKIVRSF